MIMIKKVALALQEKIIRPGHFMTERDFEDAARTAIEAMREPTEEMLNVVRPQPPSYGRSLIEIWQVMIDAALKDDKPLDPNIIYPGKDPDFLFPEEKE